MTYPAAAVAAGTHLAIHPEAADEKAAGRMNYEARANLAMLQRYVADMVGKPEGRRYMLQVEETCRMALEWAQTHSKPEPS
jgi:hypothetical protein